MSFALDEDQQMLARTAREFVAERSPVSRVRQLRDARDLLGYSPTLYGEMAELGWTGIPFREEDGGLGLGLASLVLVTEALGRTLAPEPILSSVMLGGQALSRAGSSAQKHAWLPAIIDGKRVLALAYQEARSRYALERVEVTARRSGDGYLLQGDKVQVLDGHGADGYVVSARTRGEPSSPDGISLFLLDAGSPGLGTTRQWRVDSRNSCLLHLADVQVAEDALLGPLHGGLEVLQRTVDGAIVALCGEMLGGMGEAFSLTLEYLKQRKQFDTLIGSFQALQHRAGRLFIEIELARSATMAAARALDAGSQDASALVCVAKARCSDAYVLVTNEAVQMHGGIGMTDEHDIGFYMKRARASEATFGDAAFQRDRYATLHGY